MNGASNWWDGVELWVTGLAFVPQVVLVLVVILPIALIVAFLLDTAVHGVLGIRHRFARRVSAHSAAESGDH